MQNNGLTLEEFKAAMKESLGPNYSCYSDLDRLTQAAWMAFGALLIQKNLKVVPNDVDTPTEKK